MLEDTEGFTCSRTFASFEKLQPELRKKEIKDKPAVVLMDIRMTGVDGIEATSHVKARFPDTAVVMMTMHNESELIHESLRAGASGYLLKDTPFEETVRAIEMARTGGMVMPAPVASKVLGFFKSIDPKEKYGLTGRELQVLHLMCDGLSHRNIADRLDRSTYTVGNHIRSIYRKLHVHSASQAVSKAIRERLVDSLNDSDEDEG